MCFMLCVVCRKAVAIGRSEDKMCCGHVSTASLHCGPIAHLIYNRVILLCRSRGDQIGHLGAVKYLVDTLYFIGGRTESLGGRKAEEFTRPI